MLALFCEKHMRKQNVMKLFVIILLLCLMSTTILSAHFITTNSVHACVGADCCTCVKLYYAQNVFRLTGMAIFFLFFKAVGLFAIYVFSKYEEYVVNLNTLINLKVRHNN